ncbi:MAG: hypothetical protein RLZ98_392 [Pseudomonadota bacterium]
MYCPRLMYCCLPVLGSRNQEVFIARKILCLGKIGGFLVGHFRFLVIAQLSELMSFEQFRLGIFFVAGNLLSSPKFI